MNIEISDRNGTEYGYGVYINAVDDGIIYASSCMSKNASKQSIAREKRNVLARGRRALSRIND
jgi:hypothetical protein